ncbi:MAG: glycosyltransferase [Bacteroidetes bacterium]|nr:glycosyltransferase [Bacteroidota bacterium]
MSSNRVLVAPLDWGLGHATRCVPIINALIAEKFEVVLAAEGATANLLQKEFPLLKMLPLKGYGIKYSRTKAGFFIKIMTQLPKILAAIKYENRWLDKIIEQEKIDCVISDNRLGLYSKKIPAYYITHQLHIETGNAFFNWMAQKIHYRYINKYIQCWVPDCEGALNLAGKLSHPLQMPKIPVKYIGILSRFKKISEKPTDNLLIALSGPEPQRSVFENIILKQINEIDCPVLLIRGLPGETTALPCENERVKIINHLPAGELNKMMAEAGIVISRAGYSTIMDLAMLQKNAVLVPTPGQGEQQYLAKYLMEKKYFLCEQQQNFSLKKLRLEFAAFTFTSFNNVDGFKKEMIINAIKNGE